MTNDVRRVVCISGASAGIGAACAETFARAGFDLVLGARRLAKLERLAESLRQSFKVRVLCEELDVRDTVSVKLFSEKTLEFALGNLDVLINNAGLAKGVDPVAMGQEEDWQAMLDTNVMGLLRLTRALLPAMLKQRRGHIINLGSIAGFQTYPGGAVYAGTKHCVRAIGDALRMELLGTPIRVTSLDPGLVETEFSEVRLGDSDKAKDVYKGLQPLTGRDIADCALFAATRPAHVNLDHMIIMPVAQASVYHVHRDTT